MNDRFTLDGSDELERRVAAICEASAQEVTRIIPAGKVDLILLGGGYGRGEGGVLRTEEGDQLYNDVEFYVLVRGNRFINQRRYNAALHHAGELLSERFGIEIEFKLLSLRTLRVSPHSMFYYDLVSGHHCLYGDEALLGCCDHHLAAHRIPLHEATRLLMNRCSGLLFSSERLGRPEFTAAESDFVGRNFAKLKLALGDVVLAARGQYHWSCRERHKRLKKLEDDSSVPNISAIIRLHEEGVRFKLHPRRSTQSREELLAEIGTLKELAASTWLWLEKRRLGVPFESMEHYGTSSAEKCPETNPLKNRLVNARNFGLAGIRDSSYPRRRLLNSLALLLWNPQSVSNPALLSRIQLQLATRARDFSGLVTAYEKIWKIFN